MLNKTKYKLYICFSLVLVLFITTLFVFKPVIKMAELYTLFARVSPKTLQPVLDFGNANFMLSSVVPMMPVVQLSNYPIIFDMGLCSIFTLLIGLFLFFVPNIFISVSLSLIAMFAYILGSIYMSRAYDIWIPVVWPLLIQLFVFVIMFAAKSYLKQNKLINTIKIFGYDVTLFPNSIPFIKNIVQQPKKMDITMACFKIKVPQLYQEDIYTNSLVYEINEIFQTIVDGCLKYDGLIDKTSNNTIYCYWFGRQQAMNAVKACMEINHILMNKNSNIKVSCGISTENSIFALLGSNNFSNYTVIGPIYDIVNRLENACIFNNASILISNKTFNLLRDKLLVTHKGTISVNGLQHQMDFYEPVNFVRGKKGEF